MNTLRAIKRQLIQTFPAEQLPPPPADWHKPFDTLRAKWVEVPTTRSGRKKTTELLALDDAALLREWETSRADITTGAEFSHRGWYHALYADALRGKKVLDVGSGFAIDSITFAQHGANVTFLDLAASNLQVVQRLCKILGLTETQFVLLDELNALKLLDTDYDVIMAMGSLHHAPQDIIKPEAQELLKHLKLGGRWLQLAYPKTRWERDGRPPFARWGQMTDGLATPWAEWYDLTKLLDLLAPAEFETVLCQEFHNSDFIWFDLLYRAQEG